MFKRVFFEDWTLIVPAVGFCFFFSLFLYLSLRALRMGRSKRERLASLPLNEDTTRH